MLIINNNIIIINKINKTRFNIEKYIVLFPKVKGVKWKYCIIILIFSDNLG